MNAYKLVEWSYPTSPNAKEYGFYKTGCFTLHTASMTEGHNTVGGYATLAEAKKVGEPLPYPWHPEMSKGWRSK